VLIRNLTNGSTFFCALYATLSLSVIPMFQCGFVSQKRGKMRVREHLLQKKGSKTGGGEAKKVAAIRKRSLLMPADLAVK